MNNTALFICGSLFGATAAITTVAIAQAETDPLKLSPQLYTARLENNYVRVYEYRIKPGVKDPMHSHPHGLVYALAGGTIRSTAPDGKSSTNEIKAGELVWREGLSHALENVGTTEMHALSVELKPCTAAAR
jgi:quercetin dioxygenase-like cupin family protein